MNLLAQHYQDVGNLFGIGPLGLENTDASMSGLVFNRLISIVLGTMTMFAGIWFLILLVTAAYKWMNAGGDKAALEEAREKMLHAVIGLVIVIAAIFIVDLVGNILGISYITDPNAFINYVVNP
jgi:hypothetical protein